MFELLILFSHFHASSSVKMRGVFATLFMVLGGAAGLSACGSNYSAPDTLVIPAPVAPVPTPPAPTPPVVAMSAITGVAAVGKPIAGGTVSARCAGAVTGASATTSATGAWSMSLASASMPCALEVSGGTIGGVANTLRLHSYAAGAGVANITTLTDMVIALSANADPVTWFAGLDATHPPAIAAALAAAQTKVIAGLSSANYALPSSGGFNLLTSPFNAAAGDAYDAMLDAFALSLANSGLSFQQLLTNVLGAAPSIGLSLPAFGFTTPVVPPPVTTPPVTTPPVTPGGFALVAKSNIVAADIASAVTGSDGSFGTVLVAGTPKAFTNNCGIQVKADGALVLIGVANGVTHTITASANGDVSDQIFKISVIDKIQAFDFATNSNVIVEFVRGKMTSAVATRGDISLSCTRLNPHITSVGNAVAPALYGATAADFDISLVGTYKNATCTITVSSSGVMRLVEGAVDVSATLGGEPSDVIVVPAPGYVGLQAEDGKLDGTQTQVYLDRAVVAGQPTQYSGSATVVVPKPFNRLANCQGLVKQ
ncbi:MAG: hypothetical protein V4857_11015 [Pseudomonadota bacterium]